MTPDPSGAALAPQQLTELLAEVRGALQQATPGPWHRTGWSVLAPESQKYLFSVLSDPEKRGREDVQQATRNLNFIAKSPEWLGALVQAVEDQQREIVKLNELRAIDAEDSEQRIQNFLWAQERAEKAETLVAQLRADGQRLEERIKTARKFVLSAVGNLAEQNWGMCETELEAVLAALTTSDLGRDAP